MKRLNQFTKLPKEDQTLILNLCDKLPYKEVVATLAKPRAEGGLDLTTCPSSLSKFYTRNHREMIALESIGQFAAALQINHQAHGEANFQAILSLVQTRLLEALRAGKPIDDLQKYFRTLERVQKCFLTDEKFRHQNERTQEAYLTHIKHTCGQEEEPDFVDHTEEDPHLEQHKAEFEEVQTLWERDLEFAAIFFPNSQVTPASTFLRPGVRIVNREFAKDIKLRYLSTQNISPALALPEFENPTPENLLALQRKLEAADIAAHKQRMQEMKKEISTQDPSKSPAISTISTNFQSSPIVGDEVTSRSSNDKPCEG